MLTEYQERVVKALESMAASLEKIEYPLYVIKTGAGKEMKNSKPTGRVVEIPNPEK